MPELVIIGGGLAGCEAAWQAAQRGIKVFLYEMRPVVATGAHISADLAELVCSNSLGSRLVDRASGVLKEELRLLDSLLLHVAEETSLPAGAALAVDRKAFAEHITSNIVNHPNIKLIRQEVIEIPKQPAIIASGPLTSLNLSRAICSLTGQEHLYFYDAIAPVVTFDSINLDIAFRGSRYSKGDKDKGDYINCPMMKDEYEGFIDALLGAERIELKSFEHELEKGVKAGSGRFFEGCLPVEVLAVRGRGTLAFGPMRPVGLIDPRNGRHPYAVVQLRQDNTAGTLYNLVGFQTNLKYYEQKRIFHMIPGLEQARFERYGQMHRNTFIFSPANLLPTMQFQRREDLFFAGQITGVEGYTGNIATGLLAGWNAARVLTGLNPITLPETTMIGSLCHYITHAETDDFQPMKANFGILPELETNPSGGRRHRAIAYSQRALSDMTNFLSKIEIRHVIEPWKI